MNAYVVLAVVIVIGWLALILLPRFGRPGRFPLPLRDRLLSPEQEAAVAEAEGLRRSDPATAQGLLDQAFERDGQREDEERSVLRIQAQTNRAAAEELRERLGEDLEVWGKLLKNARKNAAKDPVAEKALVNLEKWDDETRVELDQVNELIRKHDASHRSGAA